MQGLGIFIGFFIFLGFLSIGGGSFTDDTEVKSNRSVQETAIISPAPSLTKAQRERKLVSLYRELDSLTEDMRVAQLHDPISPYTNNVTLRVGNARNTDYEREYLILEASRGNNDSINISNWYVESYVTEERVALPQGAKALSSFRSTEKADIYLAPGERAYLLTGENPLRTSFHENQCTGYLDDEYDFYPSLSKRCPDALDDMLTFANIDLDNDACYDFVESVGTCELVEEEDIEDADVSRRCEVFLEDLQYNGCTNNHKDDPFFADIGDWRIYLERDEELWRKEREIIRLIDEDDRIISVLEY